MRARDYFCGAGGASRGLHDAGFDVVGYDVWPVAVATHNANGLPAHVHDLSDPSLDHLLADPVDLAWFSTPCQPFSAAGDGEGEFDGRDGFPWALRILALTLPPVAIFENVKGLTFRKHRGYLSGILESVRALGYHVEHKVLNTADYGVPQTRERFIAVARRDGEVVSWPTVTHTESEGMLTQRWVSAGEACGWDPNDEMYHQRGKGMIERHGDRPAVPATRPSPTVRTGGGGDPGGFIRVNNKTSTTCDYYRRDTDLPSPTIGSAAGVNWWRDRPATTINGDVRVSAPGHHDPNVSGSQQADAIRVTIDELATLQGFPAGWTWCGNKTEQARQIGNAVPPRLAQVVAAANLPVSRECAA